MWTGVGRWKRWIWSDADTDTDADNFKIHFYIFATLIFSYLMLLLQQYSLPNPGVDLLSIYKQRDEG